MIYSKKGVSTIVANVLIVLLVIVGVAVIWAVVNPTLEKSAQGVKAADCFNLRLSPTQCTFGTSVTLSRSAGAGAVTNVKLIFKDSAGVTYVSTQPIASGTLDELESKTFTALQVITTPAGFPAGSNNLPGSFPAAGTLTFNVASEIGPAGNTIVCEALSQPINCIP